MLFINKHYNCKVKNVDTDDNIIEIIGATQDVDRVGDKMFLSGIRLENYLKNPVILANHQHDAKEKPTVIGKAIDVRIDGYNLIFKIKFADTENARDWYSLYANGFMNAASVGFNEIKSKPNNYGGYDYLEWELLELSLVSIPCNQNAVTLKDAVQSGIITKSAYNIVKGEDIVSVDETKEIVEEEIVEEEVKKSECEIEDEDIEEKAEESVDETEEIVEESKSEIEETEEVVEETICKNLKEKKTINRKIKFVNDGGNKMNKFEKFRDYLVNKSLTGAAASAGSLLPEDFVADVIDRIEKDPFALRNFVNVYNTTLRNGKVPVTKTELDATWVESDGEPTLTEMSFDHISYTISDILSYLEIANDLLADTPINLYNELQKQVYNVIVKKENAAIINGDGNNKPTGIIRSAAQKTLTTAMTADDVMGLPYEIDVTWRQNGSFVVPSALMKEIRLMKNVNGDYLFVQGSVINGVPSTLAGYPVMELKSVGSNQIIFGDLKQYTLFDRQQLTIELDSSCGFVKNVTTARFGERIDGKVAIPAAFVVLNQKA